MKKMNYVTISVIIFLLYITPYVSYSQNTDAELLVFTWAFMHMKEDGTTEILDSEKDLSLFSGDCLKIYLKPIQNVYIYIYLYDSQKQLTPLSNEIFGDFSKHYKMGDEYYIPSRDEWFVLDENRGIETFYLMASSERLTSLEKLTEKYIKAKKQKREKLKFEIVNEIKNLRKKHSELKTFTEKPVSIAGTVRGMDTDIKTDARLVEAHEFYGKTVILEHK